MHQLISSHTAMHLVCMREQHTTVISIHQACHFHCFFRPRRLQINFEEIPQKMYAYCILMYIYVCMYTYIHKMQIEIIFTIFYSACYSY